MGNVITSEKVKRLSTLSSMSYSDLASDDLMHIFDVSESDVNNRDKNMTSQAFMQSMLSNFSFRAKCATATSVQTKQVYVPYFIPADGVMLRVKFVNGNSVGLPAPGSNIVAAGDAPKLAVYADSSLSTVLCSGPIIANGQYVGESFVGSGGTDTLMWNAEDGVWEDQTTTVLYSHSDANSSYTKYTDGKIDYKIYSSSRTVPFPIKINVTDISVTPVDETGSTTMLYAPKLTSISETELSYMLMYNYGSGNAVATVEYCYVEISGE